MRFAHKDQLRCPITGSELELSDVQARTTAAQPVLVYPVRGGVPILLASEAVELADPEGN